MTLEYVFYSHPSCDLCAVRSSPQTLSTIATITPCFLSLTDVLLFQVSIAVVSATFRFLEAESLSRVSFLLQTNLLMSKLLYKSLVTWTEYILQYFFSSSKSVQLHCITLKITSSNKPTSCGKETRYIYFILVWSKSIFPLILFSISRLFCVVFQAILS